MTKAMRAMLAVAGLMLVSGASADETKGMAMPRPASSPADEAFAAASAGMMKGMDVKPTGNPDVDFVDMMIPHHQGAIAMAKVELQYGKDPMLRKLATDIVRAQEAEIAEMTAWKAAHAK